MNPSLHELTRGVYSQLYSYRDFRGCMVQDIGCPARMKILRGFFSAAKDWPQKNAKRVRLCMILFSCNDQSRCIKDFQ